MADGLQSPPAAQSAGLEDACGVRGVVPSQGATLCSCGFGCASPCGTQGRSIGLTLIQVGTEKRGRSHRQADALLKVAGPRHLIYFLALRTGLRRSELRDLQWGDLRIAPSVRRPHIALRAEATKAKRADSLPLKDDIIEALRQARPVDAKPTDSIFASTPKMLTFRSDLKKAGITEYDDRGRKVCFHSLRVTYGTWLAQAGVAPRVHMELMRHTDMKLTMTFYTDPRLLDTAGAMNDLPGFENGTPQESERSVALRTGTDDLPIMNSQNPQGKSIALNRGSQCPELSISVQKGGYGHEKTPANTGVLMRELGLEPRTYALKGRCSAN